MKKNMGTIDRVVRIALAVVFAALLVTGKVGGVLAIVLGIVAAAFLVTSLVGWCPAYLPLKFSTCKRPGGTTPAA